MLTIKNLTKRTVVFNLPHEVACSPSVCTCSRVKSGVVDHDKRTGDRTVRAVNQRLGASVTLFPKGTKGDKGEALDQASGLLDNVARVVEVKQAKARGEIEIVHVPDAAPAAPAAPAAAPAEAEPAAEAKAEAPKAEPAKAETKGEKKNTTKAADAAVKE